MFKQIKWILSIFIAFANSELRAESRHAPRELTAQQSLSLAKQLDYDDDGFSNADDNCPAHANPDQLDSDKNGIGDICQAGESTKVESEPTGILLKGPPNSLAVEALKDYVAPRKSKELETASHGGNQYYRQLLKAVISSKTTVEQVNQAMIKAGVRLSFSRALNPAVTLTVSEPQDLEGLRAIAQKLKASGSFALAGPSFLLSAPSLTHKEASEIKGVPVAPNGLMNVFKKKNADP